MTNFSRLHILHLLFTTAILLTVVNLSGCSKKSKGPESPDPTPVTNAKAIVYLTKGDKSQLFARQGDLEISDAQPTSPKITVDTAFTFQTVEGYGAALTGSSAYVLKRYLTAGARSSILNELFNPASGIGLSYLRLTIGASDFSLSDFSYDDMPTGQTDFNLEKFTLSLDTLDVVPVLKEIVVISPQINLLGSPWSPPAWMKTSQSMEGGKLKTECYGVYARYFVKYIQAMKQEGINIQALTCQNEPLYWTASYPCMQMEAADQLVFVRDHLGPALQQDAPGVKVLLYDHNWDHPEYPISILNDESVKQYVAGSAFHAYAGDVSAMSSVHYAHSDMGLYFTEISGGTWATNFSDNLLWNMKNILIGTARNWSKNALLWNLALNQAYGPTNNGCEGCRGVITVSASGLVTRNEEYYSLAHFSKFVRPGAVRVQTLADQGLSDVDAVAFQNTDGTKVLIVANYGSVDKNFSIAQGNRTISYTIAAKAVATIRW